MNHRRVTLTIAGTLAALSAAACSDYRSSNEGLVSAQSSNAGIYAAKDTIHRFKMTDPTLKRFFDESVGYAVLPVVTKGGLVVGAAHADEGVLFEAAKPVGSVEMTQVTVGAQIGGQDFAEIIFFQNQGTLDHFKKNNLEFAANASAVAASAGAAASSDFSNGVAVFTMPIGGLMAEAAIGGQGFTYKPFLETKAAETAAKPATTTPKSTTTTASKPTTTNTTKPTTTKTAKPATGTANAGTEKY